ncbi:uncharacterized protein LOC128475420 [Spea bombifrons]|uniref:uncharacterized protein LOC128475420 n=1 Tax=Spea bombifrons TaxID=233779 RepID=UPI00234A622C|nr:uncharacterized protein LOC128475420 [Spea bombifrons]
MNRSFKKVTFSEEPVFGSGRRPMENHTHSGILHHYYPQIAKQLALTSHVYRKLKENGILTTEQIGLLELEETQDGKISKLIEVLRNADHHVFTTFCVILYETGHRRLAQTLQNAIRSKREVLPKVPSLSSPKQILNETVLLHYKYDNMMKEENIQLGKKMQAMRKKYTTKLKELEEQISLAKWKRDLVIKERNIICSENEALQNLNTELQALIGKLQDTSLQSNARDLGFSVDIAKSRTFYPRANLGLIYR